MTRPCTSHPPLPTGESTLTTTERVRYQQQLVLPEIGSAGQCALKRARVLLIGVGGLGGPAAAYLAAAGVGTLGIVDDDRVELSNLQRQILFATAQVGLPKADTAVTWLRALNPHIRVTAHAQRLRHDNAAALIADYDLMIDGSDNLPTRYLLNDTCVQLRKPWVYGSVYRFEGQVSTFMPDTGPCYRCLYPRPPDSTLASTCTDGGVLGVVPGLIGMLQATEAIKLIVQCGAPLIGRLLHLDGLTGTFREIRISPRSTCSCRQAAQPLRPLPAC